MNQFTVPQFIDVEDKIIGAVTVRQFIIIMIGFVLNAICYRLFDFSAFLTITGLNLLVIGVVAFAKVNGRPFHFFLLNLIQTNRKPSLRVWNHYLSKTGLEETDEIIKIEPKPIMPVKNYSSSRLAELALVVDTQGSYRGEIKLDQSRIKAVPDGK